MCSSRKKMSSDIPGIPKSKGSVVKCTFSLSILSFLVVMMQWNSLQIPPDLETLSSENQNLWCCVWLLLLLSLHYMARVWYVERHVPELSSPKVKKKKRCMWPGLCPKLVHENLFGFSMLHSFSPTPVITGLKGKQDQIYQVIVAWLLYLKNKRPQNQAFWARWEKQEKTDACLELKWVKQDMGSVIFLYLANA